MKLRATSFVVAIFTIVQLHAQKKVTTAVAMSGDSLKKSAVITHSAIRNIEDPEVNAYNNIIKLNLTGIALKNFTFQYERIIKRKMSVALSVRFMPYSSLPIKGFIQDAMGNDDPDSYQIIDNFKVSNFAITPEVRFYLGKGYGKGFYIAPFYRYGNFRSSDFLITYQDPNSINNLDSINFTGSLSGHTAGFVLGAQWFLGKRIVLDWSILGPHFGASSGTFTGISTTPLTPADQSEIEDEINNLDIPLTKTSVDFPNPNTARMRFNGPWGGIRFGLSLGIRL